MKFRISTTWWIGLLGAIAGLAALAAGCRTSWSGRELVSLTPAELAHGAELSQRLAETSIEPFSAGRFTGSNGVTLSYRLLPPAALQPRARYPLVLILHGSGQIGEDNMAQLGSFVRSWASAELRRRFPAYVLVPQFPSRSASYSPDPADGLPASSPGPPLLAAMELVDSLPQDLPIDERRLYVVGFSMGGSAAWNALLLRPDRFAAAVPIAGVPPARSLAPRLTSATLLVVHGTADTENPPDAARAMVTALHRAGAPRIRLREYEGLEHQVPPDLLTGAKWRAWLFAQIRRDRKSAAPARWDDSLAASCSSGRTMARGVSEIAAGRK
jgi:predicted peptidase